MQCQLTEFEADIIFDEFNCVHSLTHNVLQWGGWII